MIVGLSAAAALREPLSVQVSTRRRPRRATTLAVFLSVLVLVGAGVAAYRSRAAAGRARPLVLLGPALVGLALGQVAIWVIRIAARGLTPATERRGIGRLPRRPPPRPRRRPRHARPPRRGRGRRRRPSP